MSRAWAKAILLTALIAPPAAAQAPFRSDTWELCFSDTVHADFSIGACTAIIELGAETPENTAAAHFNRANAFAERRMFDRALADYDQALRILPDDPDFLVNRGHALMEARRVEDAIADYDRALRSKPRFVAALDGRCYAQAIVGRLDAAVRDCDRALALAPDDPLLREARGFVALKAGDWSRAVAYYDAALARDPGNAQALWGRELARERLGQRAEAGRDFSAARKRRADIDAVMATRGVAR